MADHVAGTEAGDVDFHTYKRIKEEFVSNLSGTTGTEVAVVISVLSANLSLLYALRHLFQRLFGAPARAAPALVLEFASLLVPCVLSITVIADHVAEYVVGAFAFAGVVRLFFADPEAHAMAHADVLENLGTGRKRFISTLKAGVMFLTCVAILAVDFHVFPRRFAKTENTGTSVMDLGVGSAIFAMGVTSPLSRPWPFALNEADLVTSSEAQQKALKQKRRPLLNWTILAVVLVGTARMLVTKGIEYQEHVTEYGVHWNFFFTIAVLMVFGHAMQILRRLHPWTGHWVIILTLGLLLVTIYEVLLNVFGLRQYIFDDGPRGNLNLIGQNREGIFQMFGFCAIYLAAASVGRLIADQPFSKVVSGEAATSSREATQNTAIGLVGKLLVLYVGLWALQAAAIMFDCQCLVQVLLTQLIFPTPEPRVLKAINTAQLAVFLIANISTGAVNVSMQTVFASNFVAVIVLFTHAAFIASAALIIARIMPVRGRQ